MDEEREMGRRDRLGGGGGRRDSSIIHSTPPFIDPFFSVDRSEDFSSIDTKKGSK